MEMEILLPGEGRADAIYKGRAIATDQEGSAPAPFDLFLASVGTCTGIYVSRFCRKRNIPTDDIRILQRMTVHPRTDRVERIEVEICLPDGFPEKYREAVVRAAQSCTVKKHLDTPPALEVRTSTPVPA